MIWKDIIMYCVGIIILLVGVAILVRQRVAAAPRNVLLDRSSDSLLENGMENSDGVSISPTHTEGDGNNVKNDEGAPSEIVIT